MASSSMMGLPPAPSLGRARPMAVGAWPMSTGYNFQGSMGMMLAIYGRSLTQQEVQGVVRTRTVVHSRWTSS